MVKVLSSFIRGPLKPYVTGFAEELLRQGYLRTSAAQHVCFIAHLDRWMKPGPVRRARADGRCRNAARAAPGRPIGGAAMSALAPTLQVFFIDRLIRQRHASGRTIAAYRESGGYC